MLRSVGLIIISLLFATYSPAPIEVPFEFYRNQVVVQVHINGQGPFSMLVDTGTDPSAIDLATARSIGLKIKSHGNSVAGGGTDANLGYETTFPTLALGDLTSRNVAAVAIDLTKLSNQLGRKADGVLGHSLLNGRTVQIDFPKRVIRFYDGGFLSNATKPAASPGRVVLRFRYRDNVLIDDVAVNGKKIVANIDTGSNEGFNLTPDAVHVLGLEEEAGKGEIITSVGYNGASEHRNGSVGSISIGSISLQSPGVTFFAKNSGHDRETWGLNVGNGFLKDFKLTIDYRSRILMLER